jgi:GH25 family lysozyme M1 (1,4-beta-N-acetylmuramidase)
MPDVPRHAGPQVSGTESSDAVTYGIDIYDRYQDITNAVALRDSPYDFAYVKGTDGGGPANVRPDAFVNQLKAIGLPVGLYHYAQLSPSPEAQADVLTAAVRRTGATGLPPALDLEDPHPATFASRPFAERFLLRLVRNGYRQVTLYANTSMLNGIRAWELHDVIRRAGGELLVWAANYGNNDGAYTASDATRLRGAYPHPVWVHQYSSTVAVPGVSGRVDGNKMLHPLGEDDMTPDELMNHEITWHDGKKARVGTILSEVYIASRGLRGVPAFDGDETAVQLPPLVGIRVGVDGLGDDESNIVAALNGAKGDLLTAIAAIDGQPSDEQIAALAQMLGEQLGGEYTVTIQRNDTPGDTPA